MKILVLGDCQSNGNNCMSDEVMQDARPRSWSLRHHGLHRQVVQWAMAARKRGEISGTFHWPQDAWKHLRRRELAVAWPSLLPNATVRNLSVNGAHFLGHCHRLRLQLADHRPDHVIITDHRPNHVGFLVRAGGGRYVFEGDNYQEHDYKQQYPREVHEARLQRQAAQKSLTWQGSVAKHARSYRLLERMLREQRMDFTVLRFGGITAEEQLAFDQFMPTDLDCSAHFRRYLTGDGLEWSTLKLLQQAAIAQQVAEHLRLS